MSSSDLTATQRWRLDLAYDGRRLHGFAYQPHHDTVVGLLRSALATALRLDGEPFVVGAGRTDAGVHAFAQVVHVDLPAGVEGGDLVRSLNGLLRGRVRILAATPVPATFHARHSATSRTYRYLVLETAAPLPLTDEWSWAVAGPLDLALMNEAAAATVGEHDFRAFCRRAPDTTADQPIRRRVDDARWERLEDRWSMSPHDAPVVRLTIRAQSFCHNMVRALTSTMVAIGQGSWPVTTVAERLASGRRERLPALAPAGGLALVAVGYDGLTTIDP